MSAGLIGPVLSQGFSPVAAVSYSDTLFANAALPASGAGVFSDKVVDVGSARFIVLYIKYTSKAGSTSGRPAIQPLASNAAARPAAGDDSWYPFLMTDGSVDGYSWGVPQVPINDELGTVMQPTPRTAPPPPPLKLATAAHTNVEHRWFQFSAAEKGDRRAATSLCSTLSVHK
jgi:hypothetical protein